MLVVVNCKIDCQQDDWYRLPAEKDFVIYGASFLVLLFLLKFAEVLNR